MSEEKFLSLGSVFAYLKCNQDSRCFMEGEKLLNAKHVILVGIEKETDSRKDIFALCLQTSALKMNPHELRGIFIIEDDTVSVQKFTCTCKAGLSGTCKHVSAVLLKCTR